MQPLISYRMLLPMIALSTVGYEGLSLPAFLSLLQRCRISRIIDVREMPISRKRGFSKTALSQALKENGIHYSHLSDLGCPKEIRNDYRATGDWSDYTVRFNAYLQTQDEAIGQVYALAREERCALLCFEKDFNFCHRTFVAERLADLVDQPVKIEHLTGPMKDRVVVRELVTA